MAPVLVFVIISLIILMVFLFGIQDDSGLLEE